MLSQEQEEEQLFLDVLDEAAACGKRAVFTLAKATFLAVSASLLAGLQRHSDYPEIMIGIAVFVTALTSSYRWVAKWLIIWCAALFLITPEMVAGIRGLFH